MSEKSKRIHNIQRLAEKLPVQKLDTDEKLKNGSMKMNTNDIATVYVAFTAAEGGKRRPVYILKNGLDTISFLSITSKYHTKSDKIKLKYVEIRDWKQAGLKKESWIDVGTLNELPKNNKKVKWKKIGELSPSDLQRLEERMEEL